ncbi:ATP-binding cassette domain-containing protein [Streptomyces sp. NPDC059680]|uniref:ATP-binding cassette domain-containing protein n=1 Tax=Streptomyces sp. NPDC059680 TaxID=3346904 RepID=UPI0036C91833
MHLSTAHEPSTPTICARELSKRYGRRQAVSGLDLTVEAGQICALLGPNEAGKTSTMRMLVGRSSSDTGSASILGELVGLGTDVLRRVGVLIDGPAFVPHLTDHANLRLL